MARGLSRSEVCESLSSLIRYGSCGPLTLDGRFLTTGPPGKSQIFSTVDYNYKVSVRCGGTQLQDATDEG